MLEITRRFGVAGAAEVFQLKKTTDVGGYADLTGKYTGSEELACVLWPGDNRAQTTTLDAEWLDADLGQIRVTFPLATMETLEVTWYSGMLKLADGSADLAAFRLVVEAGPGAGDAPAVYHTYKDLVDELPFVGQLASHLKDQSGFSEVAAAARRWIDAAILRSAPDRYCGFGCGGGNGFYGNGNGFYGSLNQAEDPIIAAALNADQLIITTATGHRFVEASVYYTLAKILKRAVGMQTNNDLLEMSRDYEAAAEKKLKTCVAEIDINADGWPEYVIPLGSNKVRRA